MSLSTYTPTRPRRLTRFELGSAHPEWLAPSRIPLTIVCGPPGAGKSTYVAEHKADADIVIDLDVISAKLSGQKLHSDRSKEWLHLSIRARNQYLAALSHVVPHWPAAWFIVGEPTAAKRNWWAEKLKPQMIVLIQTDISHCLSRRPEKSEVIRQWFLRYTPRHGDVVVSGQEA